MLNITISSPVDNGAMPATITGSYSLGAGPPGPGTGGGGSIDPPKFTVLIIHGSTTYGPLTVTPVNGTWSAPVPNDLPNGTDYTVSAKLEYDGNSDTDEVTGVHKP